MTNILLSKDGAKASAWQSVSWPTANGGYEDKTYDCVIVGGGITGLIAALLLQKAGKVIVIAEGNTCGFGTTGGTSAHINTFADTTYSEAESTFGLEGAPGFANAIKRLSKINSNEN